jgi:hypothetical protein
MLRDPQGKLELDYLVFALMISFVNEIKRDKHPFFSRAVAKQRSPEKNGSYLKN